MNERRIAVLADLSYRRTVAARMESECDLHPPYPWTLADRADLFRFVLGSTTASEAGHKGGLHAAGKLAEDEKK